MSYVISGSRLVLLPLSSITGRVYIGCFLSVSTASMIFCCLDSKSFWNVAGRESTNCSSHSELHWAAGDRFSLWLVTNTPPTHQQGKQLHLAMEKHSDTQSQCSCTAHSRWLHSHKDSLEWHNLLTFFPHFVRSFWDFVVISFLSFFLFRCS